MPPTLSANLPPHSAISQTDHWIHTTKKSCHHTCHNPSLQLDSLGFTTCNSVQYDMSCLMTGHSHCCRCLTSQDDTTWPSQPLCLSPELQCLLTDAEALGFLTCFCIHNMLRRQAMRFEHIMQHLACFQQLNTAQAANCNAQQAQHFDRTVYSI